MQLTTKVKIKPLSTGLRQNLTQKAQVHCKVEVLVVENGTTTSEATTIILGATITLIAIHVYQLKIMLYLPFQQSIQL